MEIIWTFIACLIIGYLIVYSLRDENDNRSDM